MAENVGLLKCTVRTAKKDYSFEAILFRSVRPEEQKINPSFYVQWAPGKKVHEGVHYEMQLMVSPAFKRVNPDVPIHVYENPVTDEHFMCYTPQIETREHAQDVFRTMCVGTVYAIENDDDFAHHLGPHQDDFLEFMASEYGIVIIEE